jgi:hypothetical protein
MLNIKHWRGYKMTVKHLQRTIGDIDIVGIKRCYVNNLVIKAKCPGCGETLECDLNQQCLYYPVVGENTSVNFCCDTCADADEEYYEFSLPVKILNATMTVEYDPHELEPE